ncbi:MAG: hypothetical protein PHW04_09070 [Candidatus Wallbacteria bacterium]|nr:hypothetical protein [Candidatus Wallbacteria bacterium]
MRSGPYNLPMLALISLVVIFLLVATYEFSFLKKKVKIISCEALRQMVKSAVTEEKLRHPESRYYPGQIVNLENLYKQGYLKEYQECPNGGAYTVNQYGEIYCSFHNYKQSD